MYVEKTAKRYDIRSRFRNIQKTDMTDIMIIL